MKNEYFPYPAVIEEIRQETFDTKTFQVRFQDKIQAHAFQYKPGQFMQVSLFSVGEAPISISSLPSRRGILEFTIRKIGKVTESLHNLKNGDCLYLRGPYGNSFPFQEIKGKNIYFVAGGIGLAPLRSLINLVFNNRKDFKHIKVLYGAKTPDELCFKEELQTWKKIPDTEVFLTVDKPACGWTGIEGVVTELWKYTSLSAENAVAIVCGPLIMMKFVALKLLESGLGDDNIYMSLERYMKCGIGKCGHCNIAEKFVCVDGPVFTYAQIKKFPQKENVF